MRRRGEGWRVTELEESDYERVEKMARAGATKAAIAAKLGVVHSALTGWIAKGDSGDAHWAELARRIHAAEADFEQGLLDVVKLAGASGDWRAAAWILERRFPTRWALERMPQETTVPAVPAATTTRDPWLQESDE